METSKVRIMALVLIALIISPALVVSNVEEAAVIPNGMDKQMVCTLKCNASCMFDPHPKACILNCMVNCMKPIKGSNTNADFCTTGCMLTTCFNDEPDTYTKDAVKSCAKTCLHGCNKSSNKPCSP